MSRSDKWLLPAGIEEVLPPDAYQLELLCRQVIDQFRQWGYELIIPPFIEYLESLMTGTGDDLDIRTFKITDQLTGRLMGIRADMTPQVARIDSHKINKNTPSRLCYLGMTLHTRPLGPGGTRAPLQIGAEIYGHAGPESDAEILSLMLTTLQGAGIKNCHVDIGHIRIYRKLLERLQINADQEALVFNALQKKAVNELQDLFREWSVEKEHATALIALLDMHGDRQILDEALKVYQPYGAEIRDCICELKQIADLTHAQVKDAPLFFDLADLHGYKYHNGMMFTTYIQGQGQGIAFGGRYDGLGREFGRARPATGFSMDIKRVFDLVPRAAAKSPGIFAPDSAVPGLSEVISELRKKGERIVCQLPGQIGSAADMDCDRELYLDGGRWKVREIK